MKIRNGFVSNSSSSSFIISKKHLTDLQVWAIKNHIDIGHWIERNCNKLLEDSGIKNEHISDWMHCYKYNKEKGDMYRDAWEINETEESLAGYTSMDNFNMEWFMNTIGVDMLNVKWDDGYSMLWDKEEDESE